jgi:hypothetical protein
MTNTAVIPHKVVAAVAEAVARIRRSFDGCECFTSEQCGCEDIAQAALAAALPLLTEWMPIRDLPADCYDQVLCCHREKRWIRFGRRFPGHGSRWYYSGTNERSQWAQTEGDEPTDYMPMPVVPT